MPDLHCPGRTSAVAYLSSTVVNCPDCGGEVEIFGDEIKVRCRCGSYVFREALPSCAQWCKEAERCFGQAGDFPAALKNNADPDEIKKQEARFREIQACVIASLNRCGNPERQTRQASQ